MFEIYSQGLCCLSVCTDETDKKIIEKLANDYAPTGISYMMENIYKTRHLKEDSHVNVNNIKTIQTLSIKLLIYGNPTNKTK